MSTQQPKRPDPAVEQVYESSRSKEKYQILYVDEQIVLLRSESSGRNTQNSHRIERRVQFEDQIESGWFNLKPDSTLDMVSFEEIDWSQVNCIGEKTASNLHDAGINSLVDVQQASDDNLLAVDGIGEKGLANLRRFAR